MNEEIKIVQKKVAVMSSFNLLSQQLLARNVEK
jgi:hypothetical protein